MDFKIHGETWNGRLDARAGLFIYSLQRDIFNLYKNVTSENLDFRSKYETLNEYLVEADLKNGSDWFTVNLTKAATALVRKMSGKQLTAVAMTAILAWFGKDFFVSYNDRIVNTALVSELVKLEERVSESQTGVTMRALDVLRESQRVLGETTSAYRELIKFADPQSDQISFVAPTVKETVSVHTIKSRLPEPIASETTITSVRGWADFKVSRQDYVSRSLSLTAEGLPALRKAEISLIGGRAANEDFYQDIARQLAENEKELPVLRLEVLIRKDDKQNIQSVSIVSKLSSEEEPPSSIIPLQQAFVPGGQTEKREDSLF